MHGRAIYLATGTLVAAAIVAAGVFVSAIEERADRPAHHLEDGFCNPGGLSGHGNPPASVTLPFFLRRAGGALSWARVPAPQVVANDGAFLRENARGSVPTVTWIGHSTLLVQMGHTTFLTDPTWSGTASPVVVGPRRFVDPGVRMKDLPPVDFAVVSHNHYDHMDFDTLRRLGDAGTRIFVPLGNARILKGIAGVEELDWWDKRTVKGVEVHCVPARHWSRRGLFDGDKSLWSGWVVTSVDRRFYFAGDTGMFPGFAEIGTRLGPFDLAAVPIGAYEPQAMMKPSHLNPEEAIAAAIDARAERSVAIHYGTFDLSDEPIDEPPRRYRAASAAAGRGEVRDWVMGIGETRQW